MIRRAVNYFMTRLIATSGIPLFFAELKTKKKEAPTQKRKSTNEDENVAKKSKSNKQIIFLICSIIIF